MPSTLRCRVLQQLFPTRVRLQAPTDAAAAVRHGEQLQRDVTAAGVRQNFAVLSALAAQRK